MFQGLLSLSSIYHQIWILFENDHTVKTSQSWYRTEHGHTHTNILTNTRTLAQHTMEYSDAAYLHTLLLWITTDAVNTYRKLLALFLIISNIYMIVYLMNECNRQLARIRIQHPSIRRLHYMGFALINYGGVICPSLMIYNAYLGYVRVAVGTAQGICFSIGSRFPSECIAIDKYYHTLDITTDYPYHIVALVGIVTLLAGWLYIHVRVVRFYRYTPIRRNTSTAPCVIYHDSLCEDRAVQLPCTHPHTFHEQCIENWLDSLDEPSCPMCREVVPYTIKHFLSL